jgi:hypothetical protein
MVILLFLFNKLYYVTKNKIRDRKWSSMTEEVSHPRSLSISHILVQY